MNENYAWVVDFIESNMNIIATIVLLIILLSAHFNRISDDEDEISEDEYNDISTKLNTYPELKIFLKNETVSKKAYCLFLREFKKLKLKTAKEKLHAVINDTK